MSTEYRVDKFKVGDRVTWAEGYAHVTSTQKVMAPPFTIVQVFDRAYEPPDEMNSSGQSNWSSMGHTQQVVLGGYEKRTLQWDDTEVEGLWSGAFFTKIEGITMSTDEDTAAVHFAYESIGQNTSPTPTTNDPDIEVFKRLVHQHDLTYAYSDDHGAWKAGEASYAKIRAAATKIPQRVAIEIWNNMVTERISEGARILYLWNELNAPK